jgi:hypothetical protein
MTPLEIDAAAYPLLALAAVVVVAALAYLLGRLLERVAAWLSGY